MKSLFLLIFFFAIAVSFSQQITYYDDFKNNQSSMPEFFNEKGSAKIERNKYILQSVNTGKTDAFIVDCERYIDFTKDYEIEIGFDFAEYMVRFFWATGAETNELSIYNSNYDIGRYQSKWDKTHKADNNGKYDLSKPFVFKASKNSGKLVFSILQNGKSETLFELNDPAVYGNMRWGLKAPTFGKIINVLNFIKATYQPFSPKDINLVDKIDYNLDRRNMGEFINTTIDDLNSKISADGKSIYFCRKENYDVIYHSSLVNGDWTYPQKMPYPINRTNSHTVLISVSSDENTIFINGKYDSNNSYLGKGISFTQKNDNGWSNLQSIEADLANKDNNQVSYFMTADRKYLISSLNNEQSLGDNDLFVSILQEDGKYSDLINLGATINTKEREMTPFLASDNETLYFSTAGHPGYGSADIFMSRRLDDTWQNWSEPKNLGPIVNSPNWDAYYSIDARGQYAYLVSSFNSYGETDIFRVELDEAARPKPVALVKGRVLNAKTNEPVEATILFNDIVNTSVSGQASSNSITGNYTVALPYGKNYELYANRNGFYPVSDNLDMSNLDSYTEIEKDIYLVPIEIGENIRLNNIFFNTAKYDLLPASFPELRRLIKFLNDNPSYVIEIAGHTDAVGTDESNQTLSQNRANSVVAYLTENGIAADRLQPKGYGESKPIASNDTEEGKALNRRVEFKILSK